MTLAYRILSAPKMGYGANLFFELAARGSGTRAPGRRANFECSVANTPKQIPIILPSEGMVRPIYQQLGACRCPSPKGGSYRHRVPA
jgi:hypothetical protein